MKNLVCQAWVIALESDVKKKWTVQTDDNENNAVIIAVMIGAIIGIIGLSVSIIKESKEAEQMLKEEE
jgi:hypothetical protein